MSAEPKKSTSTSLQPGSTNTLAEVKANTLQSLSSSTPKPQFGGITRKKSNIDFSNLSWGTLRKYQYYFRLPIEDPAAGQGTAEIEH